MFCIKRGRIMYRFSQTSLENRRGVDPRLIEVSDFALASGVLDFGIPRDGGLRTAERQNELYKQGKSRCDGYTETSYHQEGKALDFFAYGPNGASWEREHLAIVAASFLQAGCILGYHLEWGGLWRGFPDFPHIELLD